MNGIAVDGVDERIELNPVYGGTIAVSCLLGSWR